MRLTGYQLLKFLLKLYAKPYEGIHESSIIMQWVVMELKVKDYFPEEVYFLIAFKIFPKPIGI